MENRQLGYLEQVPFFSVLSLSEKLLLSRDAQVLRFTIGQTILEKDCSSPYLYGVISGAVRMIDERPDGTESSLGLLKDGDSFGWDGDAERPVNPVAYSAAEDAQLLAIPVETLRELFSHHPELRQLFATYSPARSRCF